MKFVFIENISAVFQANRIIFIFHSIPIHPLPCVDRYRPVVMQNGGSKDKSRISCQCYREMQLSLVQRTQWASCQIRNLRFAHAPGMPGAFSPPPRISDPDMHHGTCVTHVPWCMSGSLTSGFLWSRCRGKTFPAFPAHAQPAIVRIW